MEKSQRADFLFKADHDHEDVPLPGHHVEEDNKASSMLCCGNFGPAPPPRDSSCRSPPPEAKAPRTSLASVTKLGR